jgi:hypothetical protein
MDSLYEELSKKLNAQSIGARRSTVRADIGLLLFSNRDALRDLWKAAERHKRIHDAASLEDLHNAVENLRALFGERLMR